MGDATKEYADGKVVTISEEHIGGVKIWGAGIMEDPVPGQKRGKGVQHLTSDHWVGDVGVFIHDNLPELREVVRTGKALGDGDAYRFYLNQCNMFFIAAMKEGLRTEASRQWWLLASWYCLAAAEVDGFDYRKYTVEERAAKKEFFYSSYLPHGVEDGAGRDGTRPGTVTAAESDKGPWRTPVKVSALIAPLARIDLIPAVSLERLGLHNELCTLKWGVEKSSDWLVNGFPVAKRVDSVKRHLDEAHRREHHEDAIAHLIWNFMAIYHVVRVFPKLNNCPCYDSLVNEARI